MDTAERLLRLLSLLGARPSWSGPELTQRMGITARTLRRDVARLRSLGYPVESTTGPYGGYQLGAGGVLPPLLLDDDEAVAVAIGLRAAADETVQGLEGSAIAALAKLEQVLPARLRNRVVALHSATVSLRSEDPPQVDSDVLLTVARACRGLEQLEMGYRNAQGAESKRIVEPYRLVHTGRRWYLVARDRSRNAWRTFRVDRILRLKETGARFDRTDPPDAAALVAEGMALGAYSHRARVRLGVPPERAHEVVPYTLGVLEPTDEQTTCVINIGGPDLDWLAHYLASLSCRFEVLDPPELRAELRAMGGRLMSDHAERAAPQAFASLHRRPPSA